MSRTVDTAHALLVEAGEQSSVWYLSQIEQLGHAVHVKSRERQIDLRARAEVHAIGSQNQRPRVPVAL